MIALEDLTKPVTVDEAKATIYAVLAQLGCPTTGWAVGGVVRAIVATVAIIVAAFSRVIAELVRGGFLSMARKNWLTLHAKEVYFVDRTPATFASGQLKITKTGGSIYPLGIGDLIVRNAKNKTFRNTEAIKLEAGDHTYYVGIQATEAGSASTSAAGTITSLVTSMLNVSVTNESAIVGTEEESDDSLRFRCSGKIDAMSPAGAREAYEYAAKSCGQGVTRTKVYGQDGLVVVLVASDSGSLTSSALAAVDAEIQSKVVPLGVTASVINVVNKEIAVQSVVRVYRACSLSETSLKDAIVKALDQWISGCRIGGDEGLIHLEMLQHIVAAVDSSIFHVALSSPSGDVIIQANEAPVAGAHVITVEWV